MAELEPLLAKHAEGQLTFDDVAPLQRHSSRDVVGWLHMGTGPLTKGIDVSLAIASLLKDNTQPHLGDYLAAIVKCERDTQNNVLRWGLATPEALQGLKGKHLRLRVTRRGSKGSPATTFVSYPMVAPHALDGFYLDVPGGLDGRADERAMFDLFSRMEPRFLWGSYTCVSAATGLADSRYRLHFLNEGVPATLVRNGRMIEELIFHGRRLRVYGKGCRSWTSPNLFALLQDHVELSTAVHQLVDGNTTFTTITPAVSITDPEPSSAPSLAEEYTTLLKHDAGTPTLVEVTFPSLLSELSHTDAKGPRAG
ncbi:hypothetical protein ACHHYP_17450 [Achlya hypogyna]|uniref:Uncharacterized protein n=1 Tax=Achlya hypogyna TaxID=1202772 RepID=A0A1V9Y4D7_ACHHY|nr:hypothetical protein ACHHYP_17450 [Achlya hypogyna]